jgi:hypothetical protein
MDEDAGQVLTEVIALLEAFVTSERKYAITNDSLRLLVETFNQRLTAARAEGRALPTIRLWRTQVLPARDSAFAQAHQFEFPGGRQLPLFTEREGARIASACPPPPKF